MTLEKKKSKVKEMSDTITLEDRIRDIIEKECPAADKRNFIVYLPKDGDAAFLVTPGFMHLEVRECSKKKIFKELEGDILHGGKTKK